MVKTSRVRLPSRPPFTYPLDLLVPAWPPAADAWFGFNALACWRGLAAKRAGRANQVIYWCVDYVNQRFGQGLMTRVFEGLDGVCCREASTRFEVSAAAAKARNLRHAGQRLAPTRIVPMGSWTRTTPKTSPDAWKMGRIVFLGHLVPRQGVQTLIDALSLLRRRGRALTADIIGRGPEEVALRARVAAAGIDDAVRFHGFVEDYRDLEALVAQGSVAVAPYVVDRDSFTQFADPGKLKTYLGAGLPVVLTPVPPNAEELGQSGAGLVVEDSADAVARGIESVLASPAEWQRRRAAALAYAQRYDWENILADALASVGLV